MKVTESSLNFVKHFVEVNLVATGLVFYCLSQRYLELLQDDTCYPTILHEDAVVFDDVGMWVPFELFQDDDFAFGLLLSPISPVGGTSSNSSQLYDLPL